MLLMRAPFVCENLRRIHQYRENDSSYTDKWNRIKILISVIAGIAEHTEWTQQIQANIDDAYVVVVDVRCVFSGEQQLRALHAHFGIVASESTLRGISLLVMLRPYLSISLQL